MLRLFGAAYRSTMPENAAISTLLAWQKRYNFNIFTVNDCVSGEFAIYHIFTHFLRRQQYAIKTEARAKAKAARQAESLAEAVS